MALINCPECGNKISDQAEACPKCGYELKEKKTVTSDHLKEIKSKWNNKYLIIIALVVGAFFLLNQPKTNSNTGTGTGGGSTPSPNNNGYMVYQDKTGLSFEYPSNYKVAVGNDGLIYVAQNIDNQGVLIPYIMIGKYSGYNNETKFLTDFTSYISKEYSDLKIIIDLLSGTIGNRTVYGIAYSYTSSGHLVIDNRYAVLINNKIYMVGTKEENTNSDEINAIARHILETLTEGGR